MTDEQGATETADEEQPTEAQKRENVVRLAFGGDEKRYQEFCDAVATGVPENTTVILRGSSVTGRRWKDGAEFDADGPGTSDLDLTLVGDEAVKLFKLSGFYVPGVHSRPLSEHAPGIAPDLVPLREHLMEMVGRPVNIQASLDAVMYLRGDILGQPYHVLIERVAAGEPADSQL
ncbi:MAG: hypothetical protein ABI051_06660 [Vicinamibacterales bacterium]